MSLATLLDAWRTDPSIYDNVVAWKTLPARPAQMAPFPSQVSPVLIDALHRQGVDALYAHQVAAWQQACAGHHPVIVTGTASGKTLCYNLPILNQMLGDPLSCALYLFPTKALAQDQQKTLSRLAEAISSQETIRANTYDGDTPSAARPEIRSASRIVISNPDMLHVGILPYHTRWSRFFQRLRFVVIDEMHTYRGVFGSHVANVIRRLKRVAHFYGSFPQFILTSATIANPTELAERLIEEPVAVIDQDGAARGPRHFVIYNPPIVDRELGLRRSLLLEVARLAQDLVQHDTQAIIFTRARRAVELILTYLQQDAGSVHPAAASEPREMGSHPSVHGPPGKRIRGYRSGYLPRQRREIERGIESGQVRAVVATTALELGIDIGGMDVAMLAGYPGTIASTWQQAGRAGRGTAPSLAVLVASAEPLDQFLAHHPDYFFERSPEQALIDPDNVLILLDHVKCATCELPFQAGANLGRVPWARLVEFLDVACSQGNVHRSGERYFWMADHAPSQAVSLRSASPETVLLQVQREGRGVTIGQVDLESAYWMVHPGAVYIHEGQSYLVQSLDLEHAVAYLVAANTDYYTQPRSDTTVQLVHPLDQVEAASATRGYGEISVTTQVVGYRKLKWLTHEELGLEPLDMPPVELQTTGYWLVPSEQTVERLRDQGLWQNDPNDYGPNWIKQRDLARARDGYRCQSCFVREQQRAHHVHHKIPFRRFDSYLQANELDNLVTLCPRCHHRVELAVRMRSGLSGLAFALRHLAPLFLMCDVQDIAVHTDPRSELADGKPVVVIYDCVPAGIGFSKRLFEMHQQLVTRAYEWVTSCECTDGCPSCVGPAGEDGIGGKQETIALLQALAVPEPWAQN